VNVYVATLRCDVIYVMLSVLLSVEITDDVNVI